MVSEIQSIINTFRQHRLQFFSPAHSDATAPKQIGTLTGSVQEMAISPDFKLIFWKLCILKRTQYLVYQASPQLQLQF